MRSIFGFVRKLLERLGEELKRSAPYTPMH